jgi:hypothetical protein
MVPMLNRHKVVMDTLMDQVLLVNPTLLVVLVLLGYLGYLYPLHLALLGYLVDLQDLDHP